MVYEMVTILTSILRPELAHEGDRVFPASRKDTVEEQSVLCTVHSVHLRFC